MRTKWEILNARITEKQKELNTLIAEVNYLEKISCGLVCTGCNTILATEKDFADHFVIPDEHFLNLGECPFKIETH